MAAQHQRAVSVGRPGLPSRRAGLIRHRGAAAAVAAAAALVAAAGLADVAQATINGLTAGAIFALGAVGLSLVYGSLRLINFAHGDFLTFGAYAALLANAGLGLPLVAAVLVALAATAVLSIGMELAMWRPMRARGAGALQLILMAIGLAFVVRYVIAFVAGPEPRRLGVDVTSSYGFLGGLRIGQTELWVTLIAFGVLAAVVVLLRSSRLGKQMRALSDDVDLAETTGVDTGRVIIVIWAFAGVLAGLAGVLYASALGSFDPNVGFIILLSLFAAVILGGMGSAYGALLGGVTIGLVQEWSTLFIDVRWKLVVGFAVLVAVLTLRPEGFFGGERRL
jgi:neutral amino acid transport system permease protein